ALRALQRAEAPRAHAPGPGPAVVGRRVPRVARRRSRVRAARPLRPRRSSLAGARGLAAAPPALFHLGCPGIAQEDRVGSQARAPPSPPRMTPPTLRTSAPASRRLRGGSWSPLVSVTVGSGPHFPGAVGALAGRCRRWRRRGATPPRFQIRR